MSERMYVKHSTMGAIIIPNNVLATYTDITEWFIWRVQDISVGSDMPTEKFQELARPGHKLINLSNTAPVKITFNESGRIKPWALFSGQDPDTTSEVLAGADPTTGADGDFVGETFDGVFMKRNAAGTMTEGIFVGRNDVSGFDITIPSGNDKVVVTVNTVGKTKHWLVNNSKYVISEVITVAAGIVTCSKAATALNSPAGAYTLRVYNGTTETELKETNDFTAANSPTLVLTEVAGKATVFTTGDLVLVEYTTGTLTADAYLCHFPLLSTSDSSGKYQITGKQIVTYLVNDADLVTIKAATTGAALAAINKIYRVKASGISVGFDRESLVQQGDDDAYANVKNDATATMSLDKFESDLTALAILTGTDVATVNNIRLDDFLSNLNAVVVLFDDADHTNILLRYIMEDIRPSAQSMDGTVGSVFSAGFTIEADNLLIHDVGAGS